jgi:hypothetical protein
MPGHYCWYNLNKINTLWRSIRFSVALFLQSDKIKSFIFESSINKNWCMRSYLLAVLLSIAGIGRINAQHEIGGFLGASAFLGDLGGANNIGKPFIRDIDYHEIRPLIAGFYRYNVNGFLAVRTQLYFTMLRGDDKNTDGLSPAEPGGTDAQWFREYRNLSFRSPYLEASAMLDINLRRWIDKEGYAENKWAPYITGGFGGFYFNPTTQYLGQRVALQPLGTEGQGLPGYSDKYKRISLTLIGGGGFKWWINDRFSMAYELTYHHTFTDYIDDVSTVYPDPVDIFAFYDAGTAKQIVDLARRSVELDPDQQFGYVTAPGEQRGDPNDKDQVLSMQISFSFHLGSGFGKYYKGGGMKRGKMQCPKW